MEALFFYLKSFVLPPLCKYYQKSVEFNIYNKEEIHF